MQLTRHDTSTGPRWAADSQWLTRHFTLSHLMEVPAHAAHRLVQGCLTSDPASGQLLAPVESATEVWAAGVTYLRSREARMQESDTADVYDKVYDAERPEVFFKCAGWRARGPDQAIRIRRDATWNVPEPELALVSNAGGEIIGYTAGNDVSSRDIEGANPLYLPQAKVYDGSCSLGPSIIIATPDSMRDVPIRLTITRAGETMFEGQTGISQMKRTLEELVECLYSEIEFPAGSVLLTGAGIVPPDEFTLTVGDHVRIEVGSLVLNNVVES
ncbi:MAG: fumarylacetoacetate hydrolase [Chromatiales bacterium]|jgi:2-dehydro-3-deoxy-D-arabinonate dehydratase|nr:fumarylacetoacetate hydrolase [Chromatiales bacterium]